MGRRPGVSVVICTYTDGRLADLLAAVESARSQSPPPQEVVVAVDHNPLLAERLRRELSGARVVENDEVHGLSGARNAGVAAASSEVVAFLDDDAIAEPGWLARVAAVYDDPAVLGMGGTVEPAWPSRRPRWLPPEFDWVVGCSYRGLPTRRGPIRNPIGANMSFRRAVLESVGGFESGIGRVGRRPVGCEETELAIRACQHHAGGVIVLEPEAVVRHRIDPARMTLRYFIARCFSEGLSKALVARRVGRRAGLESERSYALRQLSRGVARGLTDALRGDGAGAARAAAIVAGLLVTTAGYLRGLTAGSSARFSRALPASPRAAR